MLKCNIKCLLFNNGLLDKVNLIGWVFKNQGSGYPGIQVDRLLDFCTKSVGICDRN
jgi:hypothetical protein